MTVDVKIVMETETEGANIDEVVSVKKQNSANKSRKMNRRKKRCDCDFLKEGKEDFSSEDDRSGSESENGEETEDEGVATEERQDADLNEDENPTTQEKQCLEREHLTNVAPEKSEEASQKAVDERVSAESEKNGPPPPYLITSPYLPPANAHYFPVPPETPPPYFDWDPSYPDGTKMKRKEYPLNRPGPTYACPFCFGTFLYHRPYGLVECPFCYKGISIGHYIRVRVIIQSVIGVIAILVSICFFCLILSLQDSSTRIYLIAVGAVALSGLFLIFRAAYLQSKYSETERIEFTE